MIAPIDKIQPIFTPENETKAQKVDDEYGSFGAVFQSAIDNVKKTDSDMAKAEYLLSTGQLDNPAELTIAASKNEIAVSLLVQLRNKAVESYNEIMRINI